MRAVRKFPPASAPRRPHPLILLSGTGQKADVWRGRMETLAAAGYECHALDFSQTGCYATSYCEQLRRMRDYVVEKLDGRPIFIGHSQGGTRAQCYLLASGGDESLDEDCSARAMVLMSSSEASLLGCTPAVVRALMATAGVARTTIAALLGTLYLDPLCFCFGGGPWRHQLQMYKALFNAETCRTTLVSASGASDARVGTTATAKGDEAAGGWPIAVWADTYVSSHEPAATDLGIVPHARSTAEARSAHGCVVLHMVASRDRIISRAQSERVADLWKVPMLLVEGQGHQMGDGGWEESVMGPLDRKSVV